MCIFNTQSQIIYFWRNVTNSLIQIKWKGWPKFYLNIPGSNWTQTQKSLTLNHCLLLHLSPKIILDKVESKSYDLNAIHNQPNSEIEEENAFSNFDIEVFSNENFDGNDFSKLLNFFIIHCLNPYRCSFLT